MALVGFTALSTGFSPASSPVVVAPKIPRGWNSWNSFKQWVAEPQYFAQADFIVSSGMRELGWEYVVADGGWYWPGTAGPDAMQARIDEYGRLIEDPDRWPSGWKAVCDQIHAKGLKCGFHLFRGVSGRAYEESSPIKGSKYTARDAGIAPSTSVPMHGAFYDVNMSHPAGQEYIDSMFELYCSWGIDFIKLDGVESGRHNATSIAAIAGYRAAIDRHCGGRDVVLSLSAGGPGIPGWAPAEYSTMDVTDDYIAAVQHDVQMARVTPDTWDIWADDTDDTPCPLAKSWEEFGPYKGDDPRWANVSHWSLFYGGRIMPHFYEFARYAHLADKFGVYPDGDMLQLGRVGGLHDLKPETLAQYASPPFTPNNCTIQQHIYPSPLPVTPASSGGYDPEMCPRQSYLTLDEQRTLVSLWSIARSPLIMGGDLTMSPPDVISLLTNRAVLQMNGASHGAAQVYLDDATGRCVWSSTPDEERGGVARYVAFFNLARATQGVSVDFASLGLGNVASCQATDLWAKADVGTVSNAAGAPVGPEAVPRHGSVVWLLHTCH